MLTKETWDAQQRQRSDRIEVSGSGAAASHGGVAAGAGGVPMPFIPPGFEKRGYPWHSSM
jgi:hypothetical protein